MSTGNWYEFGRLFTIKDGSAPAPGEVRRRLRETIVVQHRVLGAAHPLCLATEKKLAYLCWDRRELHADAEAEKVLRNVLEKESCMVDENIPLCNPTEEVLALFQQPSLDLCSEEHWSSDAASDTSMSS